ncbi:MAG: pentapeptide repeat-containing protein [Deltaproteobacteria bacterium]|nr:pentapeptide repeat-containing protein [Deltaproteobacteria bacterium]MCW5804662.1 pentapeptide repeat-containing protein [Deltaproteobacteria bacterium]
MLRRIQRGERMDRADLRNLDLSKANLGGGLFDRADLEGSNLEGSDLTGAAMKRASLREAYLVGANLSNANLENADLEGAKLERASLRGANLTRANLEGANLTNADLTGAQLSYAQLATAKLGNANLTNAICAHAELDEAYLGGASGPGARLANASLVGANLEDARFPNAILDEASLTAASLRNADFSNTSLLKTDLSGADLTGANLSGTDLRHATFTRAKLANARLTGAKAAGLVGTGMPIGVVDVTWLDLSPGGDGSQRVENGVIPSVLTVGAIALAGPGGDDARRRYFGRGDVLRNATLQFDGGARVEIDSLFQNCTIHVGEQTELVIGEHGVLADCEIVGAGNVTIHGKFFERQSPGIVGPRQLCVSARGTVVSAVAQNLEQTHFGFETGCQLRVKIVSPQKEEQVKR